MHCTTRLHILSRMKLSCKMQLAQESALGVEALGHRDRQTEAKEEALEKLSSLPSTHREQAVPLMDGEAVQQPTTASRADLSSASSMLTESAGQPDSRISSHDPQPSSNSESSEGQQPGSVFQRGTPSSGGHGAPHEAAAPDDSVVSGSGHAQAMFKPRDSNSHQPADGQLAFLEQDPSASYAANARQAVDTILHSVEQQSAILGLRTLLTILRVWVQTIPITCLQQKFYLLDLLAGFIAKFNIA